MIFFISSILGLAFGSFANVYFYRIPLNESLWTPSSHCPRCQHPIPWVDNLPLFSYFNLKGLCRFCGIKIAPIYPFIEFISLLLFIAIALKFRDNSHYQILNLQLFSFILFLAAGIDLVTYFKSGKEYGIIPDHLTLLLMATGLIFSFQNPNLHFGFKESLLGGGVAFLFTMTVRILGEKIFKKEALGLGDVKLLCGLGVWLGVKSMLYSLILGSLIGCILSLILIYLKKLNRTSPVPYGPFLATGALVVLFFC